MPVGDLSLPEFPVIEGIRLGVAQAGIKKPGRDDVVVIELAPETQVAGVFTRNAFCAAPVQVARRHLSTASPRYLLINTGNANAGTGEPGLDDCQRSCDILAQAAGVQAQQVLPFSTGVIGERLPMARLEKAIPEAVAALETTGWARAVSGILTTDLVPKGAVARCEIQGQVVNIAGIAKGSGMIRPNMATMLGYVATDAEIAQPLLQQLLREVSDQSFNRISVDGDTSTNDAVMLMATGASAALSEQDDAGLTAFREALLSVMQTLAHAIVRDGEGATKFVTVKVTGGRTGAEALETAYTVAHSPLVKTALYASDANWGRILAAVGRTPGLEDLDVSGVTVHLDDVCIAAQGGRAADYTEEAGAAVMAQDEITIHIDLGRGPAADTVWTCDFSHQYVSINADYRS